MALASYFNDAVAVSPKFDFILAEDESASAEGTWIGCTLAKDETGAPIVQEGRAPVIGQRISEGGISVDDRDPLSHLVWKQDDWSGGALVTKADKKNNGYEKGTFDAVWGTLAPGIAKNFGSSRGNTRQPIGWLLRNPHFESDADDGWSDDSGASGTVDMQDTDDFRPDILGSQACKITWTGTTADVAIISQSLTNPTVYRSKSLTVSCYLKLTAGTGGVQIAIYDGVGTTRGTGITSASDWTLVTVTRTIDASATEVTITLETEDTNTFTGYVDDFTAYSGSTTLDPVGVAVTDNGDIYTASGRIVAKLNTGTADQFRWDAVYIHGSVVATDIVAYHDIGTTTTEVFVGFGASNAYIYGTGTSWTVSTLTGNGKYAIYWAISRSTLWKSESVNTVRSATNPLNGGTWSSVYTLDDANRPITEMYGFEDTVVVGKEDGFWRYRRLYEDGTSADLFENQTSEFRTQPNERHFKGGAEFLDGLLYLPLGRGGMMRTGRGGIQDVSSIFTKPDAGINGVVYAMAGDTKNLWTFVDDKLIALMYEGGELVPHMRGDQPSVSPTPLAGIGTENVADTGYATSGTQADPSTAWSNEANVNASDNAYASHTSTGVNCKLNKARLLKGGAETGDDKISGSGTALTTSDRTDTIGGSSDAWGASLTPADVNASNFGLVLQYRDSSGAGGDLQLTNFGFSVPTNANIVGITVTVEHSKTASTYQVDHVQLKVHYQVVTSSSRVLLPKAAAVVTWSISSIEIPHLLGLYGGQDAADSEPYLITDCWALPDEGVAPVLDSSDTPASPTTHTWFSSRWNADAPTELKVASHIQFRLKDMDATQPVTVKFGVDGAAQDLVSLGTLNGSEAVQTLYFANATSPQTATAFHDIGIYLEGTYTGTSNKRQIESFQLHSWLASELLKVWQIGVQVHGAMMKDGNPSIFDVKEVVDTLTQYEDPDQTPRYFYLIEDFDGDGVATSTPVTFRAGAVTKQGGNAEDTSAALQVWNITLQETLNVS